MITINLTEAKARLSELLDQAESGEEIVITRHGKPIARILPAQKPKHRIPFEELAAFRETMPRLSRSSADLIRELRDEER
jgi:prevent-host-death family protein